MHRTADSLSKRVSEEEEGTLVVRDAVAKYKEQVRILSEQLDKQLNDYLELLEDQEDIELQITSFDTLKKKLEETLRDLENENTFLKEQNQKLNLDLEDIRNSFDNDAQELENEIEGLKKDLAEAEDQLVLDNEFQLDVNCHNRKQKDNKDLRKNSTMKLKKKL